MEVEDLKITKGDQTYVIVKEENTEIVQASDDKPKFWEVLAKNPGLIIPLASGAFYIIKGVFGIIFKVAGGSGANCYVDDDLTKLKYLTVHPLNNEEILELSNRKSNGETTGEALLQMEVLRNERRRR